MNTTRYIVATAMLFAFASSGPVLAQQPSGKDLKIGVILKTLANP